MFIIVLFTLIYGESKILHMELSAFRLQQILTLFQSRKNVQKIGRTAYRLIEIQKYFV